MTSQIVLPGEFEPVRHYYTKVLNATIHPVLRYFFNLGNRRIAERYTHLNPQVSLTSVLDAMEYQPRYFYWGGSDLMVTTTDRGRREIVVIETNSSPSGQKSMPLLTEEDEKGGYGKLISQSFLPALKRRKLPRGKFAVIYDKNSMETSGYAAALADATGEPVIWATFDDSEKGANAKVDDQGVLHILVNGTWEPISAAFRYVTQRPWNRIPALTKTFIYNPVIACLSGGRNKLLAAKAYDFHNGFLSSTGLKIRMPETIWDATRAEVPIWIQRMGGRGVVKVPYSNAGQGVFTITSASELARFMEIEHPYNQFIVQALIGNHGWSSYSSSGRHFHIGTVPDKKGNIFVTDLRFMVGSGAQGFFPVSIYARRAPEPLSPEIHSATESWPMLGTNLSYKEAKGDWNTETARLLLMDSRDFNKLGIGLDDLIEGYIQTVLAITAIDKMAINLVSQKGAFRKRLFGSLNHDARLLDEIMHLS